MGIRHCRKCGKELIDNSSTVQPDLCYECIFKQEFIEYEDKQQPYNYNQGWQCPICGNVYSPNVSQCWICSGNKDRPDIRITYSDNSKCDCTECNCDDKSPPPKPKPSPIRIIKENGKEIK